MKLMMTLDLPSSLDGTWNLSLEWSLVVVQGAVVYSTVQYSTVPGGGAGGQAGGQVGQGVPHHGEVALVLTLVAQRAFTL